MNKKGILLDSVLLQLQIYWNNSNLQKLVLWHLSYKWSSIITVIARICLFQLKKYQFFSSSKQWAAVRTYWYAIKTPPHHLFPYSMCDGAYFTWSSNDNFIDTKNGYKSLFLTSVPLKILGLGFLYLAWKKHPVIENTLYKNYASHTI